MSLQIVINQAAAPPGVDGQAREDLVTGTPVSVAAVGGPFIEYLWTFLDKPINIVAGVRATSLFATPDASSSDINPIDQPGTYLIQLAVDSGSGLGATEGDIAQITFYAGPTLNPDPTLLPRRIPAFRERLQHNVPDAIEPTGNTGGWSREWLRWFASLVSTMPAGTDGQLVTYAGTTPIAKDLLTGWTDYSGDLLPYFNTTNDDGDIGSDTSVVGLFRVVGPQTLDFEIIFFLGTGFDPGTGNFKFRVIPANLPAALAGMTIDFLVATRVVIRDTSTPANNAIGYAVDAGGDGLSVLVIPDVSPAGGVGTALAAATPWAFATGDEIRIAGSMRIATVC